MSQQTALIVGATRGIGLGLTKELISRGWKVIATERNNDPKSGLRTFANEETKNLRIEQVDINEANSISNLQKNLVGTKLDLLFINAGVTDDTSKTISQVSTEEFTRVMVTNSLSPMRAIDALDELVLDTGSIAVMSSVLGSVSENYGGYEVYRASKAALNTLMKCYAARKAGKRSLLAMHPGWVKTDMGGAGADIDVETSARGLIDTILKNKGSKELKYVDYTNTAIAW